MLDAALDYVRRGWFVFPCKPGEKVPLAGRGHLDASCEAAQIGKWWAACPDANIGVAVAPSRLVVLDVDVAQGKPGRASLAELDAQLPDTLTAITGRGGLHAVYTRSDDVAAQRRIGFRPGLDLIGDGYIVVAPSVLAEGGQYRWNRDVPPAPLPPVLCGIQAAPREVKKVALTGAQIPEGGRNNALFRLGCALRDTGIGAEALARALDAENKQRAGLPDDELAAIINSVLNTVTPSRDVAIGAVVEQEIHQIFAQPASPPRTVWLEDAALIDEPPTTFYTTGFKELDDLLGGGYATRQMSGIIAPPSAGKSSFVGDTALHLQQFRPVLHCSFELMQRELTVRYASNRENISWRDGMKGVMSKETMRSAVKGVRIKLMGCDDCDRVDPLGTIEAEAIAIKEQLGVSPFIIVDYVQLLARGSDDKKNAVGELTMRLRILSQCLDTIVFAVFSTARGFYSGPNLDKIRDADDPTAYLGAAKESGDIEFDCANIFFLDVDKTHVGSPKPARLAVARSRYGDVGFVGLSADLAVGKFVSDPSAIATMSSDKRGDKRAGDKLEVLCVKLLGIIKSNPTWTWNRIKRAYKGTKTLVEARDQLLADGRVTSESRRYAGADDRLVTGEFLRVTLDGGNARLAHDVGPEEDP